MSTRIVPDNKVMEAAAIRLEVWNLVTLSRELRDAEVVLQWCARRRLIFNSLFCRACDRQFTYCRYSQGIDGRQWRCSGCGVKTSVRKDSFFEKSHLSLEKIVLMVYCWCQDMPKPLMQRETGVSGRQSCVDWCNFMREECTVWLAQHPVELGGFDDGGDSVVVEIDESNYFHRKFHRGQVREDHWVFGGIERPSGKCFLVEVPDRSADTLEEFIERHILPGSRIVSDGWAAYADLSRVRRGIYDHSVIFNQGNFVDPSDKTVHTQNVKNMWMRVRKKLKRQIATSGAHFTSYLDEFAFRNYHRKEDFFANFLVTLSENYQH